MKIGIVTTQFAINYGAVLQACALRKAIENLGVECEIIDYNPGGKRHGRIIPYKFDSLKSSVYSIILFLNIRFKRNRKEKIRKFDDFLRVYCNLTNEKYFSFEDIRNKLPKYDALVCGSDQVWNLNIFNGLTFFLRVEDIYPDTKFIAYAPSIAEKMSNNQMDFIAKNTSHFSAISVREEEGAKQLGAVLNKKIKNVIDPVFLLSKEEWESIADPIDIISEPYLLCYSVGGAGECFSQSIKLIREKYKLKLVYINLSPFDKFRADYNLTDLSPQNFVWLFLNAEFVITSSFHGTAFSALFKKQFFAYPYEDRSSRHHSLLRQLGIENRILNKKTYSDKCRSMIDIDYDKVSLKIDKIKEESKLFLKESIQQ